MKAKTIFRGNHPDNDIVELRRRKIIEVLQRNFTEGGVVITIRRFNKILVDLGFRLEE